MKKSFIKSMLLLSSFAALVGCSKSDSSDGSNNNGNNNGGNNTQTAPDPYMLMGLNDGDGVFVGVKSFNSQSTPMGTVDVIIGTAVAVVGDLKNSKYNDVGVVNCFVGSSPKAYELTKQANNSYVYTPSATDFQGIPFTESSSGIPFWDVPSIGLSTGSYYQFPKKPELKSSTTISKTSGYDLEFKSNDGHKLLVMIASEGKYAYKIIVPTDPEFAAQKVTFSASDLSTLPASNNALIQVVPYTEHQKTVSGKKYYFINETVISVVAKVN